MRTKRILAPLCAIFMLAIATSFVTAGPTALGSTTDTAITPALTSDLTPSSMHLDIVTGITANLEDTNIKSTNGKDEATVKDTEKIATTAITHYRPTAYGRDVGTIKATMAINTVSKTTSGVETKSARAAPYHHTSTDSKIAK